MRSFRERYHTQAAIESGCHLGPRSEFEISNPNAQGFVAFTCRKGSDDVRLYNPDDGWYGIWYRLLKAEGEEKRELFEKQLAGQGRRSLRLPAGGLQLHSRQPLGLLDHARTAAAVCGASQAGGDCTAKSRDFILQTTSASCASGGKLELNG